mmetsp:Transcript_4696/g.13454  ORF Transcript_4696/g.13454 Transcript_4696/m.13454 type:complete len:203 (-) Transcript_4696:1052-1660(-)
MKLDSAHLLPLDPHRCRPLRHERRQKHHADHVLVLDANIDHVLILLTAHPKLGPHTAVDGKGQRVFRTILSLPVPVQQRNQRLCQINVGSKHDGLLRADFQGPVAQRCRRDVPWCCRRPTSLEAHPQVRFDSVLGGIQITADRRSDLVRDFPVVSVRQNGGRQTSGMVGVEFDGNRRERRPPGACRLRRRHFRSQVSYLIRI